jgi:hypothetical protein
VVSGGATRLLGLLCPILRGEADEEEEEVVEAEESTTATSMAAAAAAAVDSKSSSSQRKMTHKNGVEEDRAVVTMPP